MNMCFIFRTTGVLCILHNSLGKSIREYLWYHCTCSWINESGTKPETKHDKHTNSTVLYNYMYMVMHILLALEDLNCTLLSSIKNVMNTPHSKSQSTKTAMTAIKTMCLQQLHHLFFFPQCLLLVGNMLLLLTLSMKLNRSCMKPHYYCSVK